MSKMTSTGVKLKNTDVTTASSDAKALSPAKRDFLSTMHNYKIVAEGGAVTQDFAHETYDRICDALANKAIDDETFDRAVTELTTYDPAHSQNVPGYSADMGDVIADYMHALNKDKIRVLFCNTKKTLVGATPDQSFAKLVKFEEYFGACLDQQLIGKDLADRTLLNLSLKDFGDSKLNELRGDILITCHQKFQDAQERHDVPQSYTSLSKISCD